MKSKTEYEPQHSFLKQHFISIYFSVALKVYKRYCGLHENIQIRTASCKRGYL